MKTKLKIVVIMGGKSSEHEISIISGTQVIGNLDERKYEVLPVVITKSGSWKLTDKKSLLDLEDPIELKGTTKEIVLAKSKDYEGINANIGRGVDVVFIAMHGRYGEDGSVQGLLELSGIRYTGSKVLASAIGMDKVMFRNVMESHGLPIPKYVVIHKGDMHPNLAKNLGKMPYFIKPVNGGSSVGASIATNTNELKHGVSLAFEYDDRILIDEYIKGMEVTCGIIGSENPIALPLIEIRPLKGNFFDYESKYTESGAEEIVPAKISKILSKKIQDMAVKVYKAIGATGFGRIDFILRDDMYPVILEINTIPGLTPMSLLPKAARAAGISYPELLDKIIEYAAEK